MAKLLIIADVENKCVATPRGLELAARLGLSADVVAFTYAPLKKLHVSAQQQGVIQERLLSQREETVQARVDKYKKPGQKVTLKVVWMKDIHKWINKQCEGGRYVAVVKTGNRTESLVHTSTDWELLRECPARVLLVAENKWPRTKPVLISLDLTSDLPTKRKLNDKVLADGKALAEALGVELEIITAIEVPTLLADLDLVDPYTYAKQVKESMQPYLSKLAADHDIPEKSFHCKRGPVERVITSHAAKIRAQIVVMGTVGRKGVKARLLGNTAERVLRHLKTDVVAIKP